VGLLINPFRYAILFSDMPFDGLGGVIVFSHGKPGRERVGEMSVRAELKEIGCVGGYGVGEVERLEIYKRSLGGAHVYRCQRGSREEITEKRGRRQ
jgi:hypothetical protein